jgi:hypothetical protein
VFFLVGCDQATKQAACKQLKDNPKTEIAGIVHLHYIENGHNTHFVLLKLNWF